MNDDVGRMASTRCSKLRTARSRLMEAKGRIAASYELPRELNVRIFDSAWIFCESLLQRFC